MPLTVADYLAVDGALTDALIVASAADNPGAELVLVLADHAERMPIDGREDAAEALHLFHLPKAPGAGNGGQ